MRRAFKQIDVFTAAPYRGNPVAVVLDGRGLSDAEMARIANWTNLSETTFVLPPTDATADYRVRIFTTDQELPFAGHPTIGTCHAWLESGGTPINPGTIIQQCEAGLITLRRDDGRLFFAAPPRLRSGPVDDADLDVISRVLRVDRSDIGAAQWVDNGPGWMAVQLADAAAVRALDPDLAAASSFKIGAVGFESGAPSSDSPAIEVRALFKAEGGTAAEDPVTGSLNASIAQWLLETGAITAPYIAAQGTVLGRAGRVHVHEADGETWIGGDATTCISGTIEA